MKTVVEAWVQGSPNTVPVAVCETRSVSLSEDMERLFKRHGFLVKRRDFADDDMSPGSRCVNEDGWGD